jgi:hypothetical protein
MAYFEEAIAYRSAADKLFEVMTFPGNTLPLRDPTYHLYHHATELVLKACLLSHGLGVPANGKDGHDIGALFELCRMHKFLGLNDAHFELHNSVVLLGEGNRWHRYRYAGPHNERAPPALHWVHEAVGELFAAVKPHVATWAKNNSTVPAPSKIRVSLGKPTYTKQPVPSKPGP